MVHCVSKVVQGFLKKLVAIREVAMDEDENGKHRGIKHLRHWIVEIKEMKQNLLDNPKISLR